MTEQTSAPYGRLLYGCMGLGGGLVGRTARIADVETAAAAIDAALDIGITLFDHADIYRTEKPRPCSGRCWPAPPGCGSASSCRPSAASG